MDRREYEKLSIPNNKYDITEHEIDTVAKILCKSRGDNSNCKVEIKGMPRVSNWRTYRTAAYEAIIAGWHLQDKLYEHER